MMVENAIRTSIIKEEKAANNWEEYVAVGSNEAEQQERRKLWMMWELWTKGDSPASFALFDDDSLPVNPTSFTGGYEGWKNWYKAVVKNKEAMDAMGRKVGTYFTVADHFKYVEKFFPEKAKLPTIKIKKMAADQKVVDDFMAGLNFGDAAAKKQPAQQKKEAPKKQEPDMNLSRAKSGNIFGFKESPSLKSGVSAAQSIEEYLLTQARPPSVLPLKQREQYPKQAALYAKNPALFWKKANDKALSSQEETKLAGILKDNSNMSAPGEKTSPSKKAVGNEDGVKESREINENRIRAMIRHELIQSMRK